MNTPTFRELLSAGRTAAECWNELDIASVALQQSFGTPFDAAKGNLLTDLNVAESRGCDLSPFSGSQSAFKFPDIESHIVVRFTHKATPHKTVDKLNAKIEKLEAELKAAKVARKAAIEQLIIKGDMDMITDKITVAFTRLK